MNRALLVLAPVAAAFAAPAVAAPATRLVDCPSGSCLAISGKRATPAAAVMINGHVVNVEGGRKWRVRLPIETVRNWSEPRARTVSIAIWDAATQTRSENEADLPIGLLGHVDLETVVIAMK